MSRSAAGTVGVMLLMGFMAILLTAQEVVKRPPVTSHDLAGKEDCLTCHAIGAIPAVPDVPEDHGDWTNQSCQWCHSAESPMQANPVAGDTPHDVVGRRDCLMCHAVGAVPPAPDVPEDHEDLPNESCLICHRPSGI